MMENALDNDEKALFILKILKFLTWPFWSNGKTAW